MSVKLLTWFYYPDVNSFIDYYPFGAPMPGRYSGGSDYRYGYQGSEKDDEITGVEGAHMTTFFREIDTRLGRMWSVDPVFQPWQSPYNSMENSPIRMNDPMGDDPGDYFDESGVHQGSDGKADAKIYVQNDQGGTEFEGKKYNEVKADSDLGKMARTVYAEAAGTSSESKVAVAEVIRNRANDQTKNSAKHNWVAIFSNVDTYGEVVEQKGQFESVQTNAPRYTDPLSVTHPGGKENVLEQRAYVQSASAAIKAHYQGTNTTDGAVYFYSPYIKPPSWTSKLQKVTAKGVSEQNFILYKFKGSNPVVKEPSLPAQDWPPPVDSGLEGRPDPYGSK